MTDQPSARETGPAKDSDDADPLLCYADTEESLPSWCSRVELAAFLNRYMRPYHDTLEDVQRGLDYAFSKRPGEGGFVLLAGLQEELAGALVILHTGMSGYVPENILLFVGVRPELRGRGIGQQLIERALEECDGAVKLHVEPDNPAQRLYSRLGFVKKYDEMRFVRS